mmetsp:Transcript_16667/g.38469  ORF Transcript_16667/g.38469 Transcript_16667/m.38469 type:complete len:480 (+) Transcript_16667:176-1615(+)|eukprot:CAMPEP_0197195870 /NCGR_PEP_ID=MMETSP1423-20130617/32008_1 /TAXON_ID=476441 /ORGANISM="Pseudo-nitzschia heimii, Strain UNC1101" /LENGTH=479 /DNA_ID=CAMNT_0042649629 /DNA_START=74 /DNA_END=1513 /DNA_ORIENTATION=-
MAKSKPLPLRRKSFGGQTGVGIWWRKRSAPTTSIPTDDEGSGNEAQRDRDSSTKESTSSEDDPGDSGTHDPTPFVGTIEDSPALGWDDDLCRPIYSRRRRRRCNVNHELFDDEENELVRDVSSSSSEGFKMMEDTDSSDGGTDSVREDKDGDLLGNTTIDANSKEDVTVCPSVIKEEESLMTTCRDTKGDELEEHRASSRMRVLPRKRTQTFGNQGKRRRPLSLILTQEDEEPRATNVGKPHRVSLESCDDITPTEEGKVTGNDSHGKRKQPDPPPRPHNLRRSNRHKPASPDMTPTEADQATGKHKQGDRTQPDSPPRLRKPRRSNRFKLSSFATTPTERENGSGISRGLKNGETNLNRSSQPPPSPQKTRRTNQNDPCVDLDHSLEKARAYFENLDKTQELTLDATRSPHVSGRVTRTRRRTNLSSPGINRAYQAYSQSIVGDGTFGIEPLCIRDYATSRQLHFQKNGQIVDGFLDH